MISCQGEVGFSNIAMFAECLEIFLNCLTAQIPSQHVVYMQSYSGILRGTRAAHLADAVVSNQHSSAKAPIDVS